MELNLFNFHTRFPSEEACYAYIIERRWKTGLACIRCGSVAVYTCKTRRLFKCKDCHKFFSPLVGTIFQDTHLSLLKWFLAIHLLTTDGVSSNQLAKHLGISQKSAWYLVQRIMDAMQTKKLILHGVVQMDEVYFGPKSRGRSSARFAKKYALLGAVEAGPNGRMALEVVKQPDATVTRLFVERHIKPGAHIVTDESSIYKWLEYLYEHDKVNHSRHEYVRAGGITTNLIENRWHHLRRNVRGRHIHVSGKHLSTYAAGGFQFRYNTRHLTADERLDTWLGQAFGSVLTYKELLQKRPTQPLALRGWARKQAALPVQLRLGF